MDSEAQPTPAVTTGDPDQETAPAASSVLAGQSATAALPSAPDLGRPSPPTLTCSE